MNGDIMQTRREKLGQLCSIDGEFTTTSAMRSTSYSCQGVLLVGADKTTSQASSSSTYKMHHPDAKGDKIS
jgi:hypothetical protein